jgi:hypothetical protein
MISRQSTKSNYDKYLASTEISERNNYFNKAETNYLMHNVFLYSAIGIWALDALFTTYQWYTAYNQWKAVRYTSYRFHIAPDPYSGGAMFSLSYRF